MFTRDIEFSIIFTRYSDRPLLLGSGSLPLNSVFPTKMGNNFKTTDNFAEIYTSCVHKLTSLPWKQCFDVNFQTRDNTFQSLVYGSIGYSSYFLFDPFYSLLLTSQTIVTWNFYAVSSSSVESSTKKIRSNLSKADTSLKRTKVVVPQVSALGRFH